MAKSDAAARRKHPDAEGNTRFVAPSQMPGYDRLTGSYRGGRRWDGPFGKGKVTNFLVRMPEGASVRLFGQDKRLLGWLQKIRGGRFVTGGFEDPALMNPDPRGNVDRLGAAEAFVAVDPGYVVHDALWQEDLPLGPLAEVTPESREMVGRVVADPGSGGFPVLERRKRDYWQGSLYPHGLAHYALMALGYTDTADEVARELSPTVSEAFERFKRARPDLAPRRWDASPGDPHDAAQETAARSSGPASTLPELTDREREVLSLLAGGKSNREIAELLHVSLGTLKNHVEHILSKLRVADTAQAVVHARDDAGLGGDER